MAEEHRKIWFDDQEVKRALVEFAKRAERDLPDKANNLSVTIQGTEDVDIALTNNHGSVRFTTEEVTAGLILYCQQAHIPLARRASKHLEYDGRRVCLHMHLTSGRIA